VNWDFLLYMLRRCCFGVKWCSWIAHCISSVCFSVLVNGTPSCFFSSSCGLRQEDPLSSLLLVFVMNGGLLDGFSLGNAAFSHLLFFDTLIFYDASPAHLCHLWSLFLCFEAASGLNINLAKSELVMLVKWEDWPVFVWGFHYPVKYLGLPLGAA
jgi:hypothetical protein